MEAVALARSPGNSYSSLISIRGSGQRDRNSFSLMQMTNGKDDSVTIFSCFYYACPVVFIWPFTVARLDFFFLGGGRYLPSLSTNYVAMSEDMGKRLPQLYYIKMKISYDLGFIAIGVAIAT